MKKRFVVALDSSTENQDNAFRDDIKSRGVAWWHWLSNLWLISDSTGQLTAQELRDTAKKHYPGVHTLVLELSDDDDTWSGFGPKTDERNMFTWLHRNWSR